MSFQSIPYIIILYLKKYMLLLLLWETWELIILEEISLKWQQLNSTNKKLFSL